MIWLRMMVVTALIAAGLSGAAADPLRMPINEPEVGSDFTKDQATGFWVIEPGPDEGPLSIIIEREFMPGLTKDLPAPEVGYEYALVDIDGDGGPELVIRLKHWTLCTHGCPYHIYRFNLKTGKWSELFVVNASNLATRPPARKGEVARLVAVIDPEEAGKPQTVRRFHFDPKKATYVEDIDQTPQRSQANRSPSNKK